MRYRKLSLPVTLILIGCLTWSGKKPGDNFSLFIKNFISGYTALAIPEWQYDYHEYFRNIPSDSAIQKQIDFFKKEQQLLAAFSQNKLRNQVKDLEHVSYEIDFNLYRLSLERQWAKAGRHIPENGLHGLANYDKWYAYFIKKFTSTDITPEEVFALGKQEVSRVQHEIKAIRLSLGYTDSLAFYSHLQGNRFYITNKDSIIKGFARIDSTVRIHLKAFIDTSAIPKIYPMEWPDATKFTPPGIYLPHTQTVYGKDVFQFNFSTGTYNRRAMEWLYMHEAIPGHHLQYTLRTTNALQELFLYPGNFEGWSCYVEYLGKDFGLFTDPYSYLGKWEWDLVRSARLVLDAGIHYYGWSHQQALDYWRATIPGQEDIAEREITRVTNWCAQALSYKVGAHCIMQMKEEYLKKPGTRPQGFHKAFMDAGNLPLSVVSKIILG